VKWFNWKTGLGEMTTPGATNTRPQQDVAGEPLDNQ
jgi:hypothetical protein